MYYLSTQQQASRWHLKPTMDCAVYCTVLHCCCLLRLQAGARKVYAVEASGMAEFARQLAERNSNIGKALQVGTA